MATTSAPAYGLERPTLTDERVLLHQIFGAEAEGLWAELVAAAGVPVSGAGTPEDAGRLAAAMQRHPDRVVALAGKAMAIRIVSYDELLAVQQLAQVSD